MKTVSCLLPCLFILFGSISLVDRAAMAQSSSSARRINLTVESQALGTVLETITLNTGYQFNLKPEWKDYPVSGTMKNVRLEQGLSRLLRGLNHTITWESDKSITITVLGKVDPRRPTPSRSIPSPPRVYPEESKPSAESGPILVDTTETVEGGVEEKDSDVSTTEEETPETGTGESAPLPMGTPEGQSGEALEQTQPKTEASPETPETKK